MFETRAILKIPGWVFSWGPIRLNTEAVSSCGPGGKEESAWPLGQGVPNDTQ